MACCAAGQPIEAWSTEAPAHASARWLAGRTILLSLSLRAHLLRRGYGKLVMGLAVLVLFKFQLGLLSTRMDLLMSAYLAHHARA